MGFKVRALGLGAAAMLVVGLALHTEPATAAGISSTKHNLSTSGTSTNHVSAGTDQICVFCHTPHGASTTAEAPLWNKNINTSGYTSYSSTTMESTTSVGGVSLACLSCHDGTQAMDNMINQPGSGGYNAGGARLDGVSWNAEVGATGKMPAGIANLGQDLSNDHPIGMKYCNGAASGTTWSCSGAGADPDFNAVANAGTTSAGPWYVNVATAGRQKTDVILYGADAKVECASCHDPHTETATFLRVANSGSALCLACHNK